MNLDSRIRDAVDETLGATGDIDQGLVALRRTRRQRAATRVGTCAVVAALALTGVLLRHHDTRVEPAPKPGSVRNGIVLSLGQGGVVEQVTGERLSALPTRINVFGPFSFASDGSRLIYSSHREVASLDLATGEQRVLTSCPTQECALSVDPSGTKVAISGRHRLTVRDLSSGDEIPYSAPTTTGLWTWSPDGRRLAGLEFTAPEPWLAVLDTDTGSLTRVARVTSISAAPAWSPDGRTLAYLQNERRSRNPIVTLMTVSSTGGQPRAVHEIGRCSCLNYLPALTWSPDGRRIAVTTVGSRVINPVYTVRPDGTGWRQLGDGFYQDRLAWQPLVTPEG